MNVWLPERLIEALREYLEEMETDEEFRESVVELYLTDEIDFETLELIIGRQDAKDLLAGFSAWGR